MVAVAVVVFLVFSVVFLVTWMLHRLAVISQDSQGTNDSLRFENRAGAS